MSKGSYNIKLLSVMIMISIFAFSAMGIAFYKTSFYHPTGPTAHSVPLLPVTAEAATDNLNFSSDINPAVAIDNNHQIADSYGTDDTDADLLQQFYDALKRPRYVILNYHHIDPDVNDNPITISPQLFAEHIRVLDESAYAAITYQQLTNFLQLAAEGNHRRSWLTPLSDTQRQSLIEDTRFLNSLPQTGYHITFDDGYESFYRYAYPILREQKIPATFFVIVRSSQKTQETAPSWIHYPHVTWEQLQTIQRHSLFEVQSHTYSLHSYETSDATETIASLAGQIYRDDLGRVETREEFLDRIYQDMVLSKSYLENRLRPHIADSLSYPYGVYNDDVIDMAQKADIAYLFTNQPGTVTYETSAFEIPRLNAGIPRLDGSGLRTLLDRYIVDTPDKLGDDYR